MKRVILHILLYFSIISYILLSQPTSANNIPAQGGNSRVHIIKARIFHYYNRNQDSMKAAMRDSVWKRYVLRFVVDSAVNLQGITICLGSANDTDNIVHQAVSLIDSNNQKYATGLVPFLVSGNLISVVFRMKESDWDSFSQWGIYITDKSGGSTRFTRLSKY